MYKTSIEELDNLLLKGRRAAEFAWEHYKELAERRHIYTLYGPEARFLGASIPSSMVPTSVRHLTKKTRRKKHVIYELDEKYNVLRTVKIINYPRIDCTYHHFVLDGVSYAFAFRGNEQSIYDNRVHAIKYEDDRPVYYAVASREFLFVQFYEYPVADKMLLSTYRYWPNATHNSRGYLINPAAPIGSDNSSVECHYTDETPQLIPFSYWFE